MYQQAPDNYVDYIGSGGGTLIFRSQDGNGRAICYAGTGNTYRSIYATFNFGALRNTTSTKQQLLTKYLEYLLPTTVAEDKASDAIRNLVVGPNPGHDRIGITFMLTGPQRVAITVYAATGQKVRDLVFSGLNPGVNRLTWDGHDDRGQTVGAGTYIVRIQAGNVGMNRTVVLIK
jgi:hypothetical protein